MWWSLLLQLQQPSLNCTLLSFYWQINMQQLWEAELSSFTFWFQTVFNNPHLAQFLQFNWIEAIWCQNCKNSTKCFTNHVLQSSQPITPWLNRQTTNNITSLLANWDHNQRLYNIYWRFMIHLNLMMTSAHVVENISPCHHKQSFSGLHSLGWS